MIKRVFLIILCLVFIIAFVGCSKKKAEEPSKPKTESTTAGNSGKSDKAEETQDEEEEEVDTKESSAVKGGGTQGSGVKVSMGQTGNNMKLPDNFPKDLVPVMEGGNIVNVNDNKDAKSIGIIFSTDKSVDDAVKFYKEVMKDAKELSTAEMPTGHMISGVKSNKIITIVIAPVQVTKNVSVMINVANPR